MDLQSMYESAKPALVAFGLKVAVAIVLYIVGRVLIGFAGTLIQKALERQKVEPTVIRYIGNAITVALNILLVVGILGYFGVETTSFAALIAAPRHRDRRRVGRSPVEFRRRRVHPRAAPVQGRRLRRRGEVEGTVRAIGLFSTTIDTPDNVQTLRRQRQDHERHDQELLGTTRTAAST